MKSVLNHSNKILQKKEAGMTVEFPAGNGDGTRAMTPDQYIQELTWQKLELQNKNLRLENLKKAAECYALFKEHDLTQNREVLEILGVEEN